MSLMRGHRSGVVGEKIQIAVGRTVFLDHNAKMQYQAMMMTGSRDGEVVCMDDSEVAANVVWQAYARSSDPWKKIWLPRVATEKAARP